jgi:hypothetical protein
MTTFEEREHGFEAKFVHDAELKFRLTSLRNRLVGQWAADQQNLQGDAREAYVASVIHQEIVDASDDHLVSKLAADLPALTPTDIAAKLAALTDEARKTLG